MYRQIEQLDSVERIIRFIGSRCRLWCRRVLVPVAVGASMGDRWMIGRVRVPVTECQNRQHRFSYGDRS